MTVISPARLATVFVELADTLIDEFDLIEFLQLVTTRVSELTQATAAGLLLADQHERLHFMAASDENMRNLELFQVQADEGPCRDCFHLGTPVVNAYLDRATDRWPRFARRAVDAGFHSVHAFPLRLRAQVIGSLGLFSRFTGDLAPEDVRVIQALADEATIGLLQERAVRHSDEVTAQLQEALTSRIVIEQAKGIIAQTLGISVDDAFIQLRTYCHDNYLPLRDIAQDITIERSESRHLRTLSKQAEPGN